MDEYRPPIPHDSLLQAIYNTDPRDATKRAAVWNDVETDMQHFDAYCSRAYSMLQTKLYTTVQRFISQPPDLNAIEAEADTVAEAAVQLNESIGTMFNFYVKMRDQYDRVGGKEGKSGQYANHLIKEQKWCSIGFGDLICMLSDIYFSLNDLTEAEEKPKSDQWAGVSTKKYFVRPEDITRVKIAICKHLPLMRFGIRQGVSLAQEKPGRRYSSYEHLNNQYDNDGEGDETRITSVYFDTPKLYSYHEKILEKDGPSVIRARWYGEETDTSCFVEKLSWKDAYSTSVTKDRFGIPFDSVGDFASGKYQSRTVVESLRKKVAIQNPRELLEMVEGVQRRIMKNKFRPISRSSFRRSTFQYETEHNVKVVLDTSVQFIKEPNDPGKSRWCRDLSKPPPPEDFFYLPFGILEVKLTGVTQAPKWLEVLLKSQYVIEERSHTFSKYFHGTARLFPLRCRVLPPWFAFPSVSYPGFPLKHWYRSNALEGPGAYGPAIKGKGSDNGSDDEEDSDKAIQLDDTKSRTSVSTTASTSVPPKIPPSGGAKAPAPRPQDTPIVPPPAPKPVSSPIWDTNSPASGTDTVKRSKFPFLNLFGKNKENRAVKQKGLTPLLQAIRVEPKTYFANERTLLQWISISVLLATYALALFALGTATDAHRVVGGGVLVFALLFSIYALGVYHYRRNAIVSRNVDGHYDDKWGPTVLVIGLFVYLLSSLILQLAVPLAPAATVTTNAFVRDYRVPFSATFLASDIPASLQTLQDSLGTKLRTKWEFRGRLNSLNYKGIQNFWDSRGTCVLRRNNYYITTFRKTEPPGIEELSFMYLGQDGHFVTRMDTTFPKANFTRQEIVSPPYQIDYMRERVFVGVPMTGLQIRSFSNMIREFFLWDVVDPLNWENPLTALNFNLTLENRGSLDVQLGSGKTATLSAYVWYQSDIRVYGELSISFPVAAGQDLTRSEMRQLKEIYDQLQDPILFPIEFNPTSNQTSIRSLGYSRTRFCS